MKKRFLALVTALVLTGAMTLTASAAPSVSAPSAAATVEMETATQNFTTDTLAEFATTTKVTSSVNATVGTVSADTAKAMIDQAKATVGANAFVASIVDLSVPAGTGAAEFTLSCPNVWAGQKVTILHQKANGTIEAIKPSKVGNNTVTFTLTSYSPVAIVIDAAAPKTGDVVSVAGILAAACLAGGAAFGKKAKED